MGFKLSSDQLENRLAVSAGACWRLSPAKLKNAHEEKNEKKKNTPLTGGGRGRGDFKFLGGKTTEIFKAEQSSSSLLLSAPHT